MNFPANVAMGNAELELGKALAKELIEGDIDNETFQLVEETPDQDTAKANKFYYYKRGTKTGELE